MLITTTSQLEGRRIVRYLGLVSGDAILGANVFRDFFAGIRDVLGGRSGSYEKVLRKAKQEAIDDMIFGNALYGGGNPARLAALRAGLPDRVPALTIESQCCGGLDAIMMAADRIASGGADAERDVKAEWDGAVSAKVALGMSRSAAIEAVKREKPDLFAEYNSSGASYARKGGR